MSRLKISSIMNWSFLWVTFALIVVGLFNLYSAVSFWGREGALNYFWSQLIWVSIGSFFMLVLATTDYRIWNFLAWPVYVFSLVLLGLALIIGQAVHGTLGWLKIGPVSIQPAEVAKLGYLLVAARYFSKRPTIDGFNLIELVPPALQMLMPFGLIVLTGDLGSAIFLIMIFGSLALFAGIKSKALAILLILAVVGGGGMYRFGLKDYQRSRILSFVHPETDVRGKGYHIVQSKIAVGSGELFGKGYLQGNINKLRYLPERHTDFIFPVFAEEWGFAGCFVLIGLYLSFLLMGIEVAKKARDRLGIFLSVGIVAMIFWQIVINLFGVLGLMPLTGVPLPFLSYGGSSMVVMLSAVGLLFSIHRRRFTYA